MTQPVPEERNDAEDLQPGDTLPGEHPSVLPGEADGADESDAQHHNAETSEDQPSQ